MVLNLADRTPSINIWLELHNDWQDVFIQIGFIDQTFG